ncbi:MAG TPA: DUF6677 family protein [Candidatus Aquilonibacter sp.]|nr:DUF6677 family protein [Candidatus Aquilonibacter sp.]
MSDEAPSEVSVHPAVEPGVAPVAETASPVQPAPAEASSQSPATLFALAAWIVPGLGHLLLGRWAKAGTFFACVVGLLICGCAMRGEVLVPGTDGPFGTLGFLADLGCGTLYFLARALEAAGSDLSRAAGDYGTRLIAAAGIVNVLAMLDAFQMASHRNR